jgi:histone-lysine N-methyltransferase SETMAR
MFQRHTRFKTGCTSVDNDEHTWRPTSCTTPETVAQIQELNCQDRSQTIHDIAEEAGIGYGTCQWVLTEELGMHRVTAKFVPRILTADQKQQRIIVCIELN